MKRIERSGPGLMNETVVPTTWDKHRSDCAKCQQEKERQVREWAKKAGTFRDA